MEISNMNIEMRVKNNITNINILNNTIIKNIKRGFIFIITFVMMLTIISNIGLLKVSSVQAEQLKINNLVPNDEKNIINDKTMQRAFNVANNNLPQSVKYNLYNNNFTIKLQNDYIHLTSNKVSLAQGLTDFSNNTITIVHAPEDNSTNCLLFTQTDSITLLHEIGHSADFRLVDRKNGIYKTYSDQPEFLIVYNKENRQLFNTDVFKQARDGYLSYYRNYHDEYFAECFALYFNSNESKNILKTHAPLTYQFIKDNIDK